MRDIESIESVDELFSGQWDDGRPKAWPTLQLRVRGRPFDVYCEDRTDVTLDGHGIPVVRGQTATRDHLRRGWIAAGRAAHAA